MAITQSRLLALLTCAEGCLAAFDRCRANLATFAEQNPPGSPEYAAAQLALAWLPDLAWELRETIVTERSHYNARFKHNERQRRYLARKTSTSENSD